MKTATRSRSAPNWTSHAVLLHRSRTRTLSVREAARLMGIPVDQFEREESQALVKFWMGLKASYGLADGGRA